VDRESVLGAVQAAQEGLIIPVLVGPEDRIRSVAATHDLELAGLSVIAAESSREAADTAVMLARRGEVDTLMKGSLQTDDLMHAALITGRGLVTDRRMSHVFLMDVPAYPRPLFITDAALNVAPDLAAKRDIVQNAIELAHAVGVETSKVAILSAVETVNPKLRSSLDAAARQRWRARTDPRRRCRRPLGFDNSVSAAAARVKGIVSEVAGEADIVVVPDLESGNILVKQLDYLGDSQAAGIALGGRVPIVLTSRADTAQERVASCALAVLVAQKQTREGPA
jgi:phosphate acetyltransferase